MPDHFGEKGIRGIAELRRVLSDAKHFKRAREVVDLLLSPDLGLEFFVLQGRQARLSPWNRREAS